MWTVHTAILGSGSALPGFRTLRKTASTRHRACLALRGRQHPPGMIAARCMLVCHVRSSHRLGVLTPG